MTQVLDPVSGSPRGPLNTKALLVVPFSSSGREVGEKGAAYDPEKGEFYE